MKKYCLIIKALDVKTDWQRFIGNKFETESSAVNFLYIKRI